MIFISHRANLHGPDKENENKPEQIMKVLDLGFYVEIDVWLINSDIYLGHDSPQYKINKSFLLNDRLICHAKNIEALEYMVNNNIHCFSHDKDDVVLTSLNWLWVYPDKKIVPNSICVLPELTENYDNDTIFKMKGICTDFIFEYEFLYKINLKK